MWKASKYSLYSCSPQDQGFLNYLYPLFDGLSMHVQLMQMQLC